MRYTIEEQGLPWGMVTIEGTSEDLGPLTDPDENGVWTDGGTITVLAFDPVELPATVSIQRELPHEPALVKIFDDQIHVRGNEIRVGDITENTFIVSCRVDIDKARIVVHIDEPQEGSHLVISIPDMTDQRVVADQVTSH